jgi:hypothetical protein
VGADPGMVAGEVRGPPRQLCLVDQLHGQRRGVQVQPFPEGFLQVVGDFLPGVSSRLILARMAGARSTTSSMSAST